MNIKKEKVAITVLIRGVEARKPLWSRSHQSIPGIRTHKEKLWNELANIHNLPAENLKSIWKKLKQSFDRRLNKIPRGESNKYSINPYQHECNWPYFKLMLFLVDQKDVQAEVAPAQKMRKLLEVGTSLKKRRISETLDASVNDIPLNIVRYEDNASKPLDLTLASIRNQSTHFENGGQQNNEADAVDSSNYSTNYSENRDGGEIELSSQTGDAEVVEVMPEIQPLSTYVGDFHFLMSLQEFMSELNPIQKLNARTVIYEYLRGIMTQPN